MALHFHSAIRTDYSFLAHPPPQKRRPLQPLPPPPSSRPSLESSPAQAACGARRRSTTFSAVTSWAAHVQPGSPAPLSPRPPYRRPSLRKGCCPSTASNRVPSASFLHIAPTPTTAHLTTPSVCDFKADLTTVGYTSVFLQLPNTPISATISLAIKPLSPNTAKNILIPPAPSPTCKPRGLARFRSLSALRSRGRSKSNCPDSPTRMKAKAAAASAAIVKRKKAKYAMRPPPLANELALMQFADGGGMDANIKRVMEAQAKAAGAVSLADVYRDGEGGVWWDQDEQWEYAHLLPEGDEARPHGTGDLQWVTFGDNTSPSMAAMPGEERRGSVSTHDSDLDPRHIIQPTDLDNLGLFADAVVPLATHKPSTSVLSLPYRPHRDAKHLRKPDFLVDVAFSRLHASPRSLKSPTSAGMCSGISKPKGKARRRPAPLKLSPPSPAFKRPTNSPIDADKVRRDFIEASFEPAVPVSVPVTPTTPATAVSLTAPVDVRARLVGSSRANIAPWRTVNDGLTNLRMKTKPSMLNMIGLFRSARKDDVVC